MSRKTNFSAVAKSIAIAGCMMVAPLLAHADDADNTVQTASSDSSPATGCISVGDERSIQVRDALALAYDIVQSRPDWRWISDGE